MTCGKIVVVQTSIDRGEPTPSPSQEIIQRLSILAKAFTVPTSANAMVLLHGTILAPDRCMVAAVPLI
jgi:hypothetical protein